MYFGVTLCGAITPSGKSGRLVSMLGTEMRQLLRAEKLPHTTWHVLTPRPSSPHGGRRVHPRKGVSLWGEARRSEGFVMCLPSRKLAYMTHGPSPPPRHHSHPQGTQPCPLSRDWTETPSWNLFIPPRLASGGKSGTTTKAQETTQTCSDSTLASRLSDWWSGFPGAAY